MSLTSRHLDRLEERFGELLGARASSRADFSEYAEGLDGLLRFLREVCHMDPTPKQVEVCRSFLEHKRTVVRGHHGAGKDAIQGVLALYAAYVLQMLVILVSATERQLLGQVWAELARRWTEADVFPGELYVGDLRIGGEKRVVAMTSGSVSNLTGWHNHRGTGVCVLISESQAEQVGEVAFDAAEGNTAGAGSRILVVGNPVKASGRFYEVSRKPTWSAIRMSAFDHPNVKEGRVVIPGGPSPTWPAEMEAEYGIESAFYVSRVLAEFPAQGTLDALVSGDDVEAAFERHDAGAHLVGSSAFPVLALDVARSLDRDESVAGIARGPAVLSLESWRVRDLTVTADRFLAVAGRARTRWYVEVTGAPGVDESSPVVQDPERLHQWLDSMGAPRFDLYVDAPGVGSGVVDDIRRRGHEVHEWWGWLPAGEPKRFANVRAEGYWRLRTQLTTGVSVLPRDKALKEELQAIEWSLDDKGRIVILGKEELRKALGRSTDRADVVVIGLAGAAGGVRRSTVGFESIAV